MSRTYADGKHWAVAPGMTLELFGSEGGARKMGIECVGPGAVHVSTGGATKVLEPQQKEVFSAVTVTLFVPEGEVGSAGGYWDKTAVIEGKAIT